ncbi:hypothetical protein Slin15195_G117460 [Septoria linicola]|uniref:Uncharacterized protein n=1 Tax=Septoria linicola TaxID=215465 RepID=A0A9Q9EQ51_9PEZI|nr:hypothetical protein Slin14017_G094470 [Septoria linicola]USW58427.1 hypothetical protein Slin15195_G117460 [Septoria linicola]
MRAIEILLAMAFAASVCSQDAAINDDGPLFDRPNSPGADTELDHCIADKAKYAKVSFPENRFHVDSR